MACHTQQEIAEFVGVHKDTINEICRNLADLPESDKAAAEHAIKNPAIADRVTWGRNKGS